VSTSLFADTITYVTASLKHRHRHCHWLLTVPSSHLNRSRLMYRLAASLRWPATWLHSTRNSQTIVLKVQ